MLNKERPEVISAMSDKLSGFKVDFEKVGFKGRLLTPEFKEWLHSEYVEPFKITQAEKIVLEELSKRYSEIRRTEAGDLRLSRFDGYKGDRLEPLSHWYSFIKNGEEMWIVDILENCEVVDNVG